MDRRQHSNTALTLAETSGPSAYLYICKCVYLYMHICYSENIAYFVVLRILLHTYMLRMYCVLRILLYCVFYCIRLYRVCIAYCIAYEVYSRQVAGAAQVWHQWWAAAVLCIHILSIIYTQTMPLTFLLICKRTAYVVYCRGVAGAAQVRHWWWTAAVLSLQLALPRYKAPPGVCMCVCVKVRKRERITSTTALKLYEVAPGVCVCVCVYEREEERISVFTSGAASVWCSNSVCVRERKREKRTKVLFSPLLLPWYEATPDVRLCVRERERERKRVIVCLRVCHLYYWRCRDMKPRGRNREFEIGTDAIWNHSRCLCACVCVRERVSLKIGVLFLTLP